MIKEDNKDISPCPLCNSLGYIDTLEYVRYLDPSYTNDLLKDTYVTCPACRKSNDSPIQ